VLFEDNMAQQALTNELILIRQDLDAHAYGANGHTDLLYNESVCFFSARNWVTTLSLLI